MNCAEFESILADYIDGTLGSAESAALERHVASCAACGAFMADVRGAVSFLKRADDVALPPALVTRIAYQVPIGRTRHPLERQGWLSRMLTKWLQPFLQPRLAMGMAMTVLSFAMLERCTGVQVQHLQPADLNPVRVWAGVEDKAFRVKDRAVKYYENLRFVYEIETRLRDLQEQQEASQNQAPRTKRPAQQNGQTGSSDSQGDRK
ncbi:MAG TPA: zf-HC2 domain-containing protein [Bryobacteraceae bacterium]|nr:zf-HC2 domain-containing protein [Bryobacteraceae bacterium]